MSCICFESDGEGEDCCTCGHHRDTHGNIPGYPGSSECRECGTDDEDADE